MTSALTRRLEARKQALDAAMARADLVRFQDGRPEVVMRSPSFTDGVMTHKGSMEVVLKPIMDNTVRLISLSGIGDAVWVRAVVRETIKAGLNVLLDTAHPWAFWDFEGTAGFSFYHGEEQVYARGATYLGQDLRGQGLSVFAAMSKRCRVPMGDFSLPVKLEWDVAAVQLLAQISPAKPVMIYRPLLRNHGRRSVESRNPDHQAYSTIFKSIRDRFHVISVATHGSGEDIIHADQADAAFHHGEIPITTLVALMKRSALVYTNAGMGLVVASALGVPTIGVLGGYESSNSYRDTAGAYGPSLLIDPINPCDCLSDSHPCRKEIDLPAAVKRVNAFIGAHTS